jgi:hypothetical protein
MERGDLLQDVCLHPLVIDADVRDGRIASQVEIYDLAVEAAVRSSMGWPTLELGNS